MLCIIDIPGIRRVKDINEDQLKRIIFSGWDFQQALSSLTFLAEEIDYDEKYTKVQLRRFRCYEVNAIISFCRPFEAARGKTTLSSKTVGIKLTEEKKALKQHLLYLRRKIVAHSDEDEMHFRGKTHDMDIRGENYVLTELVFDESLHLTGDEAFEFQNLLHKLDGMITQFNIMLAQERPDLFNFYNQPIKSK